MFKLSNLTKPTPAFWKRLGNALAGIGTSTAIPAFLLDNKTVAIGLFIAGIVGKLITSMTAETTDV